MLHDNVQRGVGPVYDAVIVPHYVRVLELSQEVHLRHQHLLFALRHGAIVQLLPHEDLQNKKSFNEPGHSLKFIITHPFMMSLLNSLQIMLNDKM